VDKFGGLGFCGDNFKASVQFRKYLSAYQFFQVLTEEDLEKIKEPSIPLSYYPVPWHWQKKKIILPYSFHEVVIRRC
jgi:hypothetical protein